MRNTEDAWRAPWDDFPPAWASAWGDDPYGLWADFTVKGATQRMRWIEPSGPDGFWMGSPQKERDAIRDDYARECANRSEHEPRRESVETGFWLADTLCTLALWKAVTGENPSDFPDWLDATDRPVGNLSWDTVMDQFIGRFAEMSECSTSFRMLLPTEKQREYAARAGAITAYWWGDVPEDHLANWNEQHSGPTSVYRYPPNPWGLYDMHGNLWEWCADVRDPRLDVPEVWLYEDVRVVRGGSWVGHSGGARAACRGGWHRAYADQFRGFRFVLMPPSGLEAKPGGAGR